MGVSSSGRRRSPLHTVLPRHAPHTPPNPSYRAVPEDIVGMLKYNDDGASLYMVKRLREAEEAKHEKLQLEEEIKVSVQSQAKAQAQSQTQS